MIELVIKIDEEDYEIMKHNIAIDNPLCPIDEKEMITKIVNGIPLPKRHGRLIDEDFILRNAKSIQTIIDVNNAPTIIEAE